MDSDSPPSDQTPTFHPHEFYPVFKRLPKVGDAVICGGQAVNLLAAVFLTPVELSAILGDHGSATSSDMDIVVSKDLLSRIEMNGTDKTQGFSLRRFSDCRQPIRFAILPDDMPDTRIDVLRTVNGVHIQKDRVFEDAIDIEAPFKVMNPVTLLIAKAENCATLEQESPTEKRNDITHLKMLVPIVRNFLMELVTNCAPESKREQRDIINHFKKLHAASATSSFKKGLRKAGVKLTDAIPAAFIRRGELETLESFLEKTFMPAISGKKSGNPPGSPS